MGLIADSMKNARLPFCTAVIVAGGASARFGADKLFAPLHGRNVLEHTLSAFESVDCVTEIVVVARRDSAARVAGLCKNYAKVTRVVFGGATRVMSAYAGVMAASEKARLIAIHDGARPLVTEKVILDAVWEAYRSTAAAPAVPIRDTVKVAKDGFVLQTPERSTLFAVQTPQVFRAELIRAALVGVAAAAPDVTDDCAAVERFGGRVAITEGSEENIKITTPQDLLLAEAILCKRENP